jgi:hypothetical protein
VVAAGEWLHVSGEGRWSACSWNRVTSPSTPVAAVTLLSTGCYSAQCVLGGGHCGAFAGVPACCALRLSFPIQGHDSHEVQQTGTPSRPYCSSSSCCCAASGAHACVLCLTAVDAPAASSTVAAVVGALQVLLMVMAAASCTTWCLVALMVCCGVRC